MSRLFFLIILMGFITFNKAYAGQSAEDKIKNDCIAKVGGVSGKYQAAYQQCLRSNGLVAVNRNLNSNDNSKSDARICYMGNPICRQCFAPYVNYSQGSASVVRTKVTQCIQKHEAAEREKERQAQAKRDAERRKKHQVAQNNGGKKGDEVIDGGQLQEIVVTAVVTCSKATPRYCKSEHACLLMNGVWNGTACSKGSCPLGSTEDVESEEGNLCKCDDAANITVERGTAQVCPSSCNPQYYSQYNSATKSCQCMAGYVNPDGLGMRCVAANTNSEEIERCLADFQTRVTSCDSSSTSAVNKCDPKTQQSSDGSTLGSLQNMLSGMGKMVGGAIESCSQAAVAGSSGYSTLSDLRDKCDTEITTCKTSCTESSTYITSNVERVYQECRENSYQYYSCRVDSPYNLMGGRDVFNADWDRQNKAKFEARVQEMQTKVTSSNSQCETNGVAVTNREKMSQFMGQMDTAYKSATQCECQLSSSGSNCTSINGPADCAADPSLAGCAKATINCMSATDNSKQCVCFKNPQSDECLGIASVNTDKVSGSNVSGFAAVGTNGSGMASNATPFASTGSNGTSIGNATSGLGSDATPFASTASGSATVTDVGSPNGNVSEPGSSGGGGSANFGKGDSGNPNAGNDESNYKSISGLFNIAKGAIGGVFGNKKKDASEGGTQQYDADGNPVTSINSKKWRPRGLGRGLAADGSDIELAGKFEDIWKVMNKQYKVQDQKDSFIFGGEKN